MLIRSPLSGKAISTAGLTLCSLRKRDARIRVGALPVHPLSGAGGQLTERVAR